MALIDEMAVQVPLVGRDRLITEQWLKRFRTTAVLPISLTTEVSGTLQAAQFPALTGDVTTVAGALATTIGPNKVTLPMIAQIATASVLGRNTALTGNVEVLTTLPSAVQDNITRTGTIVSGAWNGTKVGLAYGGTNADLSATGGASNFLKQSSAGAAVTVGTIGTGDLPAGTGTVTSVAQSFTGGLISVAGSPVTTAGTLALTVAGTSGGMPYFNSATTWATSAALGANQLVRGGGAGVAPSTSANLTFTGTSLTAIANVGVNVAPVSYAQFYVQRIPTALSGADYTSFTETYLNPASNSSASYAGQYVQINNNTTKTLTGGMYGLQFVVNNNGSGPVTNLFGAQGSVQSVSGTVAGVAATNSYGGYFSSLNQSTGSATNLFGAFLSIGGVSAQTTTAGYGLYVDTPSGTVPITSNYGARILAQGRAGITSAYGLYINAVGGVATDNYGIVLIAPGTGATNNAALIIGATAVSGSWSVYNASTLQNAWAGKTFFGGTTTPTAQVHIAAGTATANTAPEQLTTGARETTARIGVREYDSNHYLTNWKIIRFPVGGPIFDHFADVSVGGAETDIYTDTLLANIFAINGDKFIASYSGNFVTVGTELTQLKVYFANTAVWDSTGIAVATGTSSWQVSVELIRVSSTIVRFAVYLSTTGASGFVYCTVGELTGLTLTGTNILKITGTSSGVGSGAGDIVGKQSYGEYKPAI